MRNNHRTTGEVLQTFFECSKCVHIDIVGWFVKQQHIRLGFQCEGQMQAVSFTTGEHAAEFFLVGSRKIEFGEVGAGVDFLTTYADELLSTGNDLINGLFRIDVFMCLVCITDLYCFTHFERTFVDAFHSHDHFEQRGLTRTVRPDHTDDSVRR